MQRSMLAMYLAIEQRFHQIRELDRERGLTTTEIAVLTFVLVAIAVAIGGLLYSYAQGQVDSLPDNVRPDNVPDASIPGGE